MLTRQEIFDKGVTAIIKQGVKCMSGKACVYYDSETKHRCLIGHLLPEDIAIEWSERNIGGLNSQRNQYGTTVSTISNKEVHELKVQGIDLLADRAFLVDLQSAHDNVLDEGRFVDYFKHEAARLATRYNLEFNHE